MRQTTTNQRSAFWWLIPFISLAACKHDGGSDSSSTQQPPVSVAVTIDVATVQPGGTAQVTATVTNDAASRGVTWTVSCAATSCGTVSPQTTASRAATTYTAPSAQPIGDFVVTITATSQSDISASASTTLTVPGISIAITPDSADVPAGTSAEFTATVNNDSTNQGVNWTVACDALPCGTVSPDATASGAATTYTAPTTHPLGDLTVTIMATSVSSAAVSASATVTVPGIRVTVEPQNVTVPAGATAEFTATVINDPADAGVTWSLSCAAAPCDTGTVSPTTSASGVTVVYTAPSTPPPDSMIVNIVATSVSLPSAWGVATITVPAVATSVTPISALLPLNISVEFIATVGSDTASNGVNWTLSQDGGPCSVECGNVSPLTTASGAPTTYTAPGSLPATPLVAVVATSVADPSKSDSSKVTITAGSVKLVPADMAFGPAKGSQTATLTNTGSSQLTISSITLAGRNPTEFRQTNTCGNSLDAADSCAIVVTYVTTAKFKQHTAVVVISDSSIDSPQQLHLTGTTKRTSSSAMDAALGKETTAAVPKPTGSSTVGTRLMHLADSKRQDPYLTNGTMRELMVRFWYPAPSDTRCVPADYTSPGVRSYVSQLLQVSLPLVSTNSCLDARIAEGAHPVVVFTHGFTGTFTDYTFLFEDLASRGYVVASIDHTHEATAVEFPDGRLEKSVFGSYLTAYTRSDPEALDYAVTVRLEDLKFVIDELQRLNARADGVFTARLNLSRVALAGHSLGGLTAILGVEKEPRVKAGVVLDGLMPVTQVNRTVTPLLMLAAGREQWDDNECRLWDELRGPRAALNLQGADHFVFSDAVWLASDAIGTGVAGPTKTVSAIRDYVAAFLDTNLANNAPSPLLAMSSAQYPAAVLTRAEQALCSQR